MKPIPRILCIGGQDPTGGAGTQADIETVAALGGRALTLVTALTVQDTCDIARILPTPADFFTAQAETLLRDVRPDAVKIGLLGDPVLIPVLARLLGDFSGPVVLDPVLSAGGGFDLGASELIDLICQRLLPLTSLVTPNRAEVRRLSGLQTEQQGAAALLQAGAAAVLVTGADEAVGGSVVNRLYRRGQDAETFQWPRLPHVYHGSGCTLASACATRLAFGDDLSKAVETAQRFTWRALERAAAAGSGQWLPGRCP